MFCIRPFKHFYAHQLFCLGASILTWWHVLMKSNKKLFSEPFICWMTKRYPFMIIQRNPFPILTRAVTTIATTYLDKSLCWLYVPYQPKTFLVDNKSKADSSHFPYLEFLYHQTKLLKVQKRLNTVDKECWYMKNSTAVL